MGAVAVGATAVPSLSALRMATDLRFGLTEKEIDLSGIEPGQVRMDGIALKRSTLIGGEELTVPVMILRRKAEWIAETGRGGYAMKEPVDAARRYLKPEWIVVRAFCTHLGCTPNIIDESSKPVNIVCPCHGGRYDTVGRVISGPPSLNLYLIPYEFKSETRINLFISSPKDITLTEVSGFRKA